MGTSLEDANAITLHTIAQELVEFGVNVPTIDAQEGREQAILQHSLEGQKEQ